MSPVCTNVCLLPIAATYKSHTGLKKTFPQVVGPKQASSNVGAHFPQIGLTIQCLENIKSLSNMVVMSTNMSKWRCKYHEGMKLWFLGNNLPLNLIIFKLNQTFIFM